MLVFFGILNIQISSSFDILESGISIFNETYALREGDDGEGSGGSSTGRGCNGAYCTGYCQTKYPCSTTTWTCGSTIGTGGTGLNCGFTIVYGNTYDCVGWCEGKSCLYEPRCT